jgi:multicomponent Na+:H+ antiporter subunit F
VNTFMLVVTLFVGGFLVIGLSRIWSGPTVFDRLVAVALVSANSLVMLILIASVLERVETVVDIAIAYALLAFTLPIALGKHFESRRSGDPGAEP